MGSPTFLDLPHTTADLPDVVMSEIKSNNQFKQVPFALQLTFIYTVPYMPHLTAVFFYIECDPCNFFSCFSRYLKI